MAVFRAALIPLAARCRPMSACPTISSANWPFSLRPLPVLVPHRVACGFLTRFEIALTHCAYLPCREVLQEIDGRMEAARQGGVDLAGSCSAESGIVRAGPPLAADAGGAPGAGGMA
jgi:hypothetical protein